MKRDVSLFLEDIQDAVESIFSFIRGLDYNAFKDDDKTVSAVIRKLEIIGEAAKNIPHSIQKTYSDLPWSYMAKMRDRLIHGYFDADTEIIWETVTNHLQDIPPKIKNILIILQQKDN